MVSVPDDRPVAVLDVGVSSGVSTVELSTALREQGWLYRLSGIDLYLEARLVRSLFGAVLFLPPDDILQSDVLGFAFPNTPPSRISGWIFGAVRPLLRRRWRRGMGSECVPLLCSAARRSDITFVSGDVLGEVYPPDPAQHFDLIRVANVLNASYFTASQLRTACHNLARKLSRQGSLLVARSTDDGNVATVYQRDADQLRVMDHYRGGVEIDEAMLDAAE
ncbi:MAG: hypothetical protein ACK5Q5_23210 [Planctomycetaceae bacterium]